MNVTGKVKIEVIISPEGRVKSTRVVGGHPLLVQACQDAVKEWKFTPSSEETTQIVEFDFHGVGSSGNLRQTPASRSSGLKPACIPAEASASTHCHPPQNLLTFPSG